MKTATFETNKGTFTAELYDQDAPGTVANFEKLIRDGYYDGIVFHRVIPEFVVQGGDPLTKELVYLAVSVTRGCEYCIASHHAAARKKGLTDAMWGELLAVIGMANETNSLATGLGVPVDEAFRRERE